MLVASFLFELPFWRHHFFRCFSLDDLWSLKCATQSFGRHPWRTFIVQAQQVSFPFSLAVLVIYIYISTGVMIIFVRAIRSIIITLVFALFFFLTSLLLPLFFLSKKTTVVLVDIWTLRSSDDLWRRSVRLLVSEDNLARRTLLSSFKPNKLASHSVVLFLSYIYAPGLYLFSSQR